MRWCEHLVHDVAVFVQFSFGCTNCAEKRLALLELRCVVVHIVRRLEVRLKEGWDARNWEREMQDRFVVKTGGLPVVIERRVC